MLDKYGRNIDYARISLTDKCNLRCVYCMPEDKVYENNLINNNLSFNDYKFIINALAQVGISKIKFTGGEPLLYPHLIDLIKYTYNECNIEDISISTNGIGLNEIAYELKKGGLKSVNISVDSLKSYKYKSITRNGNLTDVLKSINRCLELGIKVKINCVVIKGFHDDEIYDLETRISLKDALNKIKEKEKYIILQRYLIGKTQTELAEEIGISQAQISRLEKNGLPKIKKLIK